MRMFKSVSKLRTIVLFVFVAGVINLLLAEEAKAIPALQLDIVGGTYVGGNEQSTVTNDGIFTLQALGNANDISADSTAFISVSIIGSVEGAFGDYSGILVDGNSLIFGWGTPPGEEFKKDVPGHGVYESYYAEVEFTFDSDEWVNYIWNAQDGTGPVDGYINTFEIDLSVFWASNPDAEGIHFDLYTVTTKNGQLTVDQFAPFSHDAAAAPVPEPTTLLLLGIGLVGLAGSAARKKLKKAKKH